MTGRSFLQAFAVCALLLSSGPLPAAQARGGQAATPADQGANLLKRGQYEEVETLLADQRDSRAVAVRAQALIARGRYDQATTLLTPAATSAPTSEAALELGLLQLYLGKSAEGTRALTRILDTLQPRTAADLTRLALAARALGQFQDANGYFRDANRLSADDPVVNTAWGELFLEKYELGEAQKSFQVALTADADNPAAIIGMARVAAESNRPAAGEMIKKALGINPNFVPAHLLTAEMALDDRERDEAHAAVDQALKVNPNSLEARALDAAMAFLEDRESDFTGKAEATLAINPVYGEIYRVAGDHAARNYRFDEAIALTRRSLAINPRSAKAQADLGMQLLRVGDEANARVALEAALQGDPFNSSLVTKNLLQLLDTLDKFVTVQDGDLTLRFAPEEAAVMKEQAVPLAREALDTLARRWEFTPQGPILIEMFPKHDDFAVRTLGLPGMIGALGVCFGKVVALDSPHARPPGEYNWQPTLWHEMAHVITLQMSNNRLPRWLSEGISMWEEKRARPEWGLEMEVAFAHALDQGQLLKLEAINEGFSDPKLISLTYYQASLVVQHLVDTFGEPALRRFVRAFAKGIDTPEAMKDAFGQDIAQIQTSFDASNEKRYASLRQALKRPQLPEMPGLDDLKMIAAANPGSFPVQMALGQALAAAGEHDAAIQAFEKASALVPLATGDDNADRAIASVALKKGDNARAIRALQQLVKVDHADVEAARQLAALLAPAASGGEGARATTPPADPAQAEDAYQRIIAVDPFDSNAQSGLGRLAMRRRDANLALRAFRSALATNPPDRAAAHLDLAEAYLEVGRTSEAKQETLSALEIAPSFERAQDLLLKLIDAGGRP